MKKGISLVALVITIIVLIILTAAVIWSGADTPEQTKLAVFSSDIDTIQSAVTLHMLTNLANMETREWEVGEHGYGKYVGLIDSTMFNDTTTGIMEGEGSAAVLVPGGAVKPSKATATLTLTDIAASGANEVKVYKLLPTAAATLNLSMSPTQIQNFAIDANGKVYYYKGVILYPNVTDVTADDYGAYVTVQLRASDLTSSAINIRSYK